MKSISFRKYSLNGNTFVFVDETEGRALTESEKSEFAFFATNSYFGIGADNLIFLQPCTETVLSEIQKARGYWQERPRAASADFIFRMFEPNGQEAFSCGNALTCIAHHLHRCHGLDRSPIMTRIPMQEPRVLTVGFDTPSLLNWANLGQAESLPAFMFQGLAEMVNGGPLQRIRHLKIPFKGSHPDHPPKTPPLNLTGHLVFTGEPHLVLLADEEFSDPHVAESIFATQNGNGTGKASAERRRGNYNSWLVHYIGVYLNRACAPLFPRGINVNFVRLVQASQAIEYRCFERGIDHETLACGTGAVAVSAVISGLDLWPGDTFRIHPHRCRWYKPDAEFLVRLTSDGWYLYGRPDLLYEGAFPWQGSGRLSKCPGPKATSRPETNPQPRSAHCP